MVMDAVNLRDLEHGSIRSFVQSCAEAGYLSGRVLDYGCGRQPYRDIVEEAGGAYTPYDAPTFPASMAAEDTTGLAFGGLYDTILCTQVVQYVEDVGGLFRNQLRIGHMVRTAPSYLVLTYPTNWPEVEPEDLHRFTKAGMERLLIEAGFKIMRHDRRATVLFGFHRDSEQVALGYGVVARA